MKVLAVDVDLTVVDIVVDTRNKNWLDWYYHLTGHNLYEDVRKKESSLEELMKSHFSPLDFWKKPDIYDGAVPMEDSVSALKEIYDTGNYEIVFVSHCFPEHENSKRMFLKKHFPFVSKFVSTGDKGILRPDVMIDDYKKYLRQVKEIKPDAICIHIESSINDKSDEFPYMSWTEIAQYLKGNV